MSLFSELIPFGWGHEGKGMMHFDDGVDRAILTDDTVYAGRSPHHIIDIEIDDDNPHIAMKLVQNDDVTGETTNDQSEPPALEAEPIPKEIFDESLRYSMIDRPRFSISQSSPLPPKRGSFSDPSEKIASLFNNGTS